MTAWLTGTFVAVSGLILLVLLLRPLVRCRFGASVTYALWLLPLARIAMPPLTRTVERVVPATPVPLSFAPAATAEPSLADRLGGWPALLIAAWLAVAALLLALGLAAYARQRRRVLGQGVQVARLGKVRLIRSEALRGPMAFGLFDKVVAVPADFDARYAPAERRLALDHELAHHAAGDLWANLIAFVLLCLQWFNPLAWAAHAAFRFDQEAACDARVLDKVDGHDRATYGQTIAKAASGRALLFAAALDRPTTLSRRLSTMMMSNHPRRRRAGTFLIVGAIAAALPLTATWATRYVDVAPSSPSAGDDPAVPNAAPVAALAATNAAQPTAVRPAPSPQPTIDFLANDTVRINGRTKAWKDLTAAEAATIRAETAKARADLAEHRRSLPQEMAKMKAEVARFENGDFEREIANARIEVARSLAQIDRDAPEMARHGVDVAKVRAEVRASLDEVTRIDVEQVKREAIASMDGAKLERELEQAAQSLDRIDQHLTAAGK